MQWVRVRVNARRAAVSISWLVTFAQQSWTKAKPNKSIGCAGNACLNLSIVQASIEVNKRLSKYSCSGNVIWLRQAAASTHTLSHFDFKDSAQTWLPLLLYCLSSACQLLSIKYRPDSDTPLLPLILKIPSQVLNTYIKNLWHSILKKTQQKSWNSTCSFSLIRNSRIYIYMHIFHLTTLTTEQGPFSNHLLNPLSIYCHLCSLAEGLLH